MDIDTGTSTTQLVALACVAGAAVSLRAKPDTFPRGYAVRAAVEPTLRAVTGRTAALVIGTDARAYPQDPETTDAAREPRAADVLGVRAHRTNLSRPGTRTGLPAAYPEWREVADRR